MRMRIGYGKIPLSRKQKWKIALFIALFYGVMLAGAYELFLDYDYHWMEVVLQAVVMGVILVFVVLNTNGHQNFEKYDSILFNDIDPEHIVAEGPVAVKRVFFMQWGKGMLLNDRLFFKRKHSNHQSDRIMINLNQISQIEVVKSFWSIRPSSFSIQTKDNSKYDFMSYDAHTWFNEIQTLLPKR